MSVCVCVCARANACIFVHASMHVCLHMFACFSPQIETKRGPLSISSVKSTTELGTGTVKFLYKTATSMQLSS